MGESRLSVMDSLCRFVAVFCFLLERCGVIGVSGVFLVVYICSGEWWVGLLVYVPILGRLCIVLLFGSVICNVC